MKRPKLARTLRRIADGGADEFYTGALADDIVADLTDLGNPYCTVLTLLDTAYPMLSNKILFKKNTRFSISSCVRLIFARKHYPR